VTKHSELDSIANIWCRRIYDSQMIMMRDVWKYVPHRIIFSIFVIFHFWTEISTGRIAFKCFLCVLNCGFKNVCQILELYFSLQLCSLQVLEWHRGTAYFAQFGWHYWLK
jgi:hypothetical protein